MRAYFTFPLLLIVFSATLFAQSKEQKPTVVVYKKLDTTALTLDVYAPAKAEAGKKYPVIVFFFGGGWKSGSTEQFLPHARYFSARGLVSVLVNYRVSDRNHTTPFESLKDAKSALRYLRKNAAEFQIDTGKVIASGGSAGGHLAAATATVSGFNESADDLSVSAKPNALVLFNPAIDISPGGSGYDKVGEQYKEFSPLHNIHKGVPPTIFFLGTKDTIIPVETAQYYKKISEKVGGRLDLHLYEGEAHGFFNYKKSLPLYSKTVLEADKFLVSLGYLKGEPTIKPID